MARTILRLEDSRDGAAFYLEWSSVVDAPITFGLTREEMAVYHRDEYGRLDHELHFARRMKAADENKFQFGLTAEKIIAGNRAGPDESELTYEEIVDKFWRRRGETK